MCDTTRNWLHAEVRLGVIYFSVEKCAYFEAEGGGRLGTLVAYLRGSVGTSLFGFIFFHCAATW